ncbi:MAG: HAMP domain-containing histidine kinase, partial [Bacteroidetes bacterium]|nr:HAMP domain-containing histidine kinase [Bacteroidota bacterium]
IKNEAGEVIKWYGTSTDIDDSKKIEAELKKAQEQANVMMAKKDEFIGIASHELKTPITTIKASIQAVQQMLQNKNYELTEKLLAKAEQNINKLTVLINDLLNVTKIQSGNLRLNLSKLSTKDLLESSLGQIKHKANKHQIILKKGIDFNFPGDKYRLEQVFCNLITNAIKYSPMADKIIIAAEKTGKSAKFSITDFGLGIPEDKLPLVFERFYRVEENTNQFQGLGLGLHIAKEIVLRHGGEIWAESKIGKGSTFSFTIPLEEIKKS